MALQDQIYIILWLFRIKYILFYSLSGSNIYYFMDLQDQIDTIVRLFRIKYFLFYGSFGLNIYYFIALQDQIYTILQLFRTKHILFFNSSGSNILFFIDHKGKNILLFCSLKCSKNYFLAFQDQLYTNLYPFRIK